MVLDVEQAVPVGRIELAILEFLQISLQDLDDSLRLARQVQLGLVEERDLFFNKVLVQSGNEIINED